jgi:hypothetical protein
MRVGLVIYGSIETLTGGYLYDQALESKSLSPLLALATRKRRPLIHYRS